MSFGVGTSHLELEGFSIEKIEIIKLKMKTSQT